MGQGFSDYQNQLMDLIQRYRHQVDFLAIRLERSEGSQIQLRSKTIETLSESIAIGGHVRACHRGGWGFTSFNDLLKLPSRIEEAIAAAKYIGEGETQLAPIAPTQAVCCLPLGGTDPRQISLQQKKALCDHYNELLRSTGNAITSTQVSYGDISQRVLLATSEGTLIDQTSTDMEMRFSAMARQGEQVQVGRETTGSRNGFEDLAQLDDQIIGAAQRAIASLSLPSVKGGTYPVVIDPILTGLFVHEAFGHLSEADMVYESPELLETMSFDRQFGPEDLQIFDGAASPYHRGSYLYDDEGVPATTTQLIKDGRLSGRLHSRETAGKLGETVTGNARCLNYHYPPIVRMTNTWIARGETPVTELIAPIQEGIYAKNWLGGMTNGEMFTFSAGEAWRIRNGAIAEPLKDVTLTGNVFKTLQNIEAIADDFIWDESGGCGKGGQSGLAVGCGGPSLRIRDVVVGGEAS